MPNADHDAALKSLSKFVQSIRETEDDSFFAYVGHGVELDNGTTYLVPCDANLGERHYANTADFERDVTRFCISFESVSREFVEIREDHIRSNQSMPPHSIFLLDCCRSGSSAFMNNRGGIPGPPSKLEGIKNDVKNSMTIYSTTSGNVAADGQAGHGGPFMSAFVQATKRPGAVLESILKQTRSAVQNSCGQMAPNTSLLMTDFYFIPPESTPTTPFSPSSAGSRESWDSAAGARASWKFAAESDVKDSEAQIFWTESFIGETAIDNQIFAVALKKKFNARRRFGQLDTSKFFELISANIFGQFNFWTPTFGHQVTPMFGHLNTLFRYLTSMRQTTSPVTDGTRRQFIDVPLCILM